MSSYLFTKWRKHGTSATSTPAASTPASSTPAAASTPPTTLVNMGTSPATSSGGAASGELGGAGAAAFFGAGAYNPTAPTATTPAAPALSANDQARDAWLTRYGRDFAASECARGFKGKHGEDANFPAWCGYWNLPYAVPATPAATPAAASEPASADFQPAYGQGGASAWYLPESKPAAKAGLLSSVGPLGLAAAAAAAFFLMRKKRRRR